MIGLNSFLPNEHVVMLRDNQKAAGLNSTRPTKDQIVPPSFQVAQPI